MRLRAWARSVPPLYWTVGAWRYFQFRRALRVAEQDYARHDRHANPPPHLRYRVHRSLDERSYEEMGGVLARVVVDALRNAAMEPNGRDVLDFACGPGRVVRAFHRLAPAARLSGSDIDAEAIAWDRANLGDIAHFHVNAAEPPSTFPDASFDVVYCVSLFTHLDERAQDEWLAELARILRPDGVLLASVHGRAAMASCTEAEQAALAHDGIAFRVDHTGRFKLDGLPDSYQTTFHTRGYVERHWSRWFLVTQYLPGGIHGHQDLVLLTRRPVGTPARAPGGA